VSVILNVSKGRVIDRFGAATVLSIVGGALTMFSGALTTSDAFFSQITSTGAIIIFFGGLLHRKTEKAVFWGLIWGLIITVASLLALISLPNEVRFGIPQNLMDFSPLIFLGPILALTGGLLALAWRIPLERTMDTSKN